MDAFGGFHEFIGKDHVVVKMYLQRKSMKKWIFQAAFLSVALSCSADEFAVMSEINVSSPLGLEFLLNERSFAAGQADAGGQSKIGPVSELIKAGENVLSIRIAVHSQQTENSPTQERETTQAKVRLRLSRKPGGGQKAFIWLVDDVFTVLPTNFVFTVTEDWPIKRFFWEGESPAPLKEHDKAEIRELLSKLSNSIVHSDVRESQLKLWEINRLSYETTAILKGMSVAAYHEYIDDLFSRNTRRYRNDLISFETATFTCHPTLNLVHVGTNGIAMDLAIHSSGAKMKAPEWFSKIDGKWCIVP